MQYPVIYAVLSRLNRCYSFSYYRAILVESGEKEESQKMDDLSVLASYRFGTLVMLSSKGNGLDAHTSTR